MSNIECHTTASKPHSHPSAAGFTLLEVLAAVSIISIALIGVFRLYTQTISMNYNARFYTTAPFLARQRATELIIAPDDGAVSDSGDFGENFPGYTWQVSENDVESEYLGEIAEDLKKIDITIAFNDDEFRASFSFYQFKP